MTVKLDFCKSIGAEFSQEMEDTFTCKVSNPVRTKIFFFQDRGGYSFTHQVTTGSPGTVIHQELRDSLFYWNIWYSPVIVGKSAVVSISGCD